jgi:hypothetical protein
MEEDSNEFYGFPEYRLDSDHRGGEGNGQAADEPPAGN